MPTGYEISYIDDYHRKVRETLMPLMGEKTAEWLEDQCRPLEQ